MRIDDVMAAYRHRPFRPLVLRTKDGGEYPVTHAEAMSISHDGGIVGLILPDNDFALIEVAAIKEIVAESARKRRPPPGGTP